MNDQPIYPSVFASSDICVSLVDGDPGIRHERQLLLRSEGYDVRSYSTRAALLADPRSRDYPCIVLDVELQTGDAISLLNEMRATGWRGKAVLLADIDPACSFVCDAKRHGDTVLERDAGGRSLIAAIKASVDHGWCRWGAQG